MAANHWNSLAATLCVTMFAATASAQIIPVPNADFNDNSDGNLLLVDGWQDAGDDGDQVEGVGPDGTTVMNIGGGTAFTNATAFTGVNYDTTQPGYKLSVQARASTTADVSNNDPITEDNWGFLLRDVTNGNNIKTAPQPNPVTEAWTTLELFLSQAELLQYEADNGVDADTAEIAVRFFRINDGGGGGFVSVDNVVLEISAPPVPGDVDGDGDVDLDDYATIRDNLLTTPATRSQGDVFPVEAGDSVVDLQDFSLWKTEFLAGGGTLAQIAAFDATVPEPTALVLVVLSAGLAVARRTRC